MSNSECTAPSAVAAVAVIAFVCAFSALPAGADPKSDLFQPDFFATGAALQKRTPGMMDPLERKCGLPAEALTLSAAVDVALCKNPATREAWAAAHQQAAALGAAESAWLPDISAAGSANRTFGSHLNDSGVETSGDQTTKDAAVNLSWTLYDFGARGGKIRSARYLLDAAAATADSISQQTVLSVVQGYYGVVAADATLVSAQTTQDTAAHSLEIAKALRTGGVATMADVLQAETAYDEAVLTKIQAAQSAQAAHGSLAVVIGSEAEQPLKLAPEPVPAQVPALSARMEELMAEAVRQRPDLKSAQAQRDAAVADITVARAAGRPSISISAGHTTLNQPGIPTQNYSQV